MSCFLARNSEQSDQVLNCLVMGQASWPKSSHKGIGIYTPTTSEASPAPAPAPSPSSRSPQRRAACARPRQGRNVAWTACTSDWRHDPALACHHPQHTRLLPRFSVLSSPLALVLSFARTTVAESLPAIGAPEPLPLYSEHATTSQRLLPPPRAPHPPHRART